MNELKHIAEFRKVLASYRPSTSADQALKQMHLVLLVAPSSSGRNTIINELVKTGRYHFIVSDTTRQPRINNNVSEQNGREYWFRNEEELLHDLQRGKFLEAALIHKQQVSGMSIRELKAAERENKIAINEIEVVGAANVYNAKPDTIFIFVIPPSFDEWMQRMRDRGKLPKDEIHRRLESALKEFAAALKHDYYKIIVNNDLADTVQKVDMLAKSNKFDAKEQAKGKRLVEQLYTKTKAFLEKQ